MRVSLCFIPIVAMGWLTTITAAPNNQNCDSETSACPPLPEREYGGPGDTIIATGIATTIAPAGIGSAFHATDIPGTMMGAMEVAEAVQVATVLETAVDLPRVAVVENDGTTLTNQLLTCREPRPVLV
ncbi:hypothetical protein FRB93_008996 [Tulasnella sp. JGI-2019a]|nr:hypothetical protein FRB93_008996 [Tulasnella sp. JGI-2019a]